MKHGRRAFLSLSLGSALVSARKATAAPTAAPDAFARELERLRHCDPGLIRWDEVDRVALDLDEARGIASGQAGRLWVLGRQAAQLFVGGRASRRIALAAGASCACESPDGRGLFVGFSDHVEAWSKEGERLAAWSGPGGNEQITSVVVSERFVFVADAGRRTVERCDHQGRVLGRIGDAPEGASHFVVPSPFLDLALSPSGALLVTNPGRHRVESYTEDGRPLGSFGTSGAAIDRFCGCCNPTHLAVLPDGRLVTSEKGLPRVKVYLPSGQLDSVVAAGESLAADVAGLDLAVDATGRILVLDPRERAVRIFAPRRAGGAHGG